MATSHVSDTTHFTSHDPKTIPTSFQLEINQGAKNHAVRASSMVNAALVGAQITNVELPEAKEGKPSDWELGTVVPGVLLEKQVTHLDSDV